MLALTTLPTFKNKMQIFSERINTVLFDLDGTLLDTAPDLCWALNQLLEQKNRPRLNLETVRPFVSYGGRALIRLGFDLPENHADIEPLLKQFLDIYADNLVTHTQLFPGMDNLLNHLEQNDMQWGVVTNKQAWLTDPIMAGLNLTQRSACIVSGDTTAHRKPHPAPLMFACKQVGREVDQCVYVGDHQRDVEAGINAGMLTVVALFGYIGTDENPEAWQANAMIDHPMALLDWLAPNE